MPIHDLLMTVEEILSVEFYYHVTLSRNLPAILRDGLDPQYKDGENPQTHFYGTRHKIHAAIELKCPYGNEEVAIFKISSRILSEKQCAIDDEDTETMLQCRQANATRSQVVQNGGAIVCYNLIEPIHIEYRGNFQSTLEKKLAFMRGELDELRQFY